MAILLDLQRFAEGGATGAGGDGGAPMATGNEGGMEAMQGQQNQPGFRDLLKDPRYKQEADEWLKNAMSQRFRGQEQMRQQLQQLQNQSSQVAPILSLIGQKYGKGADDLSGIQQALEADDTIYAEKAAQAGMPVKAYRKMDQLEKENQQYKAQQQAQQQEMAVRQHFDSLQQQAAELQKQFPNFNLQQELQNAKFLQWTSPQMGMSVKDAFFALHADEIQRQGMQYAGQQAAQAVAASVRSGAYRPQENATGASVASGFAVDPSQMTDEQLEDLSRRARNGEQITFG